jgi:hypothetical protein
MIWYDMMYLLTAIALTPGGSSTVHIWVDTRWQQYSTHLHTNSTQNSTTEHNIQNRKYIIKIHNNRKRKNNNKKYDTMIKMEPKEYERM